MKKTTLLILIAGLIIIVSAVIGSIYYRNLLKAYYADYKENPFKEGDKIYTFKTFAGSSTKDFFLFRLAKSKKGAKYIMLLSGKAITNDSLYKFKSSYAGKYVGRKILPVDTKTELLKDTTVLVVFYAIDPFKRALNKDTPKAEKLPTEFEYIDNNLYAANYLFDNKESTTFYQFR